MCLSTVVNDKNPEEILMEFVNAISVEGEEITLTDLMGQQKKVHGALRYADLTGAVIRIEVK